MNKEEYIKRANDLGVHSDLFIKYLDFVISTKGEGTAETYVSAVSRLLEHFKDIHVAQIKFEDLASYIQTLKAKGGTKPIGDSTRNTFCFATINFFSFASQSHELLFSPDRIDEFIKGQKKFERATTPLTVSEVVSLREIVNQRGCYTNLFAFEMFYTFGLKLDEIVECTHDTYYPDEKAFVLDSRKEPILLSPKLYQLIEDHDDLLIRKSRNWYQVKNKETGELIHRKNGLVLADINQTREQYFPACPDCAERYPGSDEFWVLLEHENDTYKTKWLYCRSCAKKLTKKQTG